MRLRSYLRLLAGLAILFTWSELQAVPYASSVRDIGGVHEKVMELTEKFDSGEIICPHTYRAGFIDRAGPYASGWAAETLEDALGRVDH